MDPAAALPVPGTCMHACSPAGPQAPGSKEEAPMEDLELAVTHASPAELAALRRALDPAAPHPLLRTTEVGLRTSC